ncbi:hypothetical protein OS493_038670 [Desmophyllum pertusum]|uniref:Uncharacterized protein n=1 Tax=Desmophyllum pertusum TaxID=174260 RepID=A0A9X0CU97_9CNID|nr:hypothetical protein OS493_038670 [Desmophyllum pertusum]
MASSEKEMIPLDAIPQGDEGITQITELFSAEDLVNVKFPSRPRRKVVIIVAVIAVVLIVAGVLIGTFVPNYMRDNDGANNKSDKGLKGKGIGEIEEEELEEEKSIPSPLGADNPADYMSRHPDSKQSQTTSHLSRIDAYVNFVTTNAVPSAVTFQDRVKDVTAADETLQNLARVITSQKWYEVGKDVVT